MIYLVVAGLSGSAEALLIRIGATLCYIIGIVFATVGIRFLKKFDFRYIAIFVDVIACLSLAQIPESIDPVLALYPMFFATSVQWQAYTEAAGFNSATIFSTNNLRQCFVGLTDYLCRHEEKSLHKFKFYGGTLLSFHVGVVYAWCCLQLWGIRSIYACLPLLAVTMATTLTITLSRSNPMLPGLCTFQDNSHQQNRGCVPLCISYFLHCLRDRTPPAFPDKLQPRA